MKTQAFYTKLTVLFLCFCLLKNNVLTAQAARYDILINEFMPDPLPQISLPNAEFIELFNRSNKSINLRNFRLVNGSVKDTLLNFTLKPNGYVTIYTRKTGVDFGKFGDTMALRKMATLTNPGDSIYLIDPSGKVIDAATYDLSFYQNSKKAEGGFSLERRRPNAPCDPTQWIASNDLRGGTPSQRNSVAADSTDKIPPSVERTFFKDSTTFVVKFDKSLDSVIATQLTSYATMDNLKINSVKILPPFFNLIEVNFSKSSFLPKKKYSLIIQKSLRDCQNTPLSKNDTLTVQFPEKPVRNDLIINELLVNPETNGSRFVEIYNRSEKAIDIADLKIVDVTKSDVKAITTNYLLFPKSYVVLTENPIYIQNRYRAEALKSKILKNKLPIWNDESGNATLYFTENSKLVILDSFNYQKTWHNALLSTVEGVSLEKINFDKLANEAASWASAAETENFGTPARQNSQFRTDKIDPSVSAVFSLVKKTFSPNSDGLDDGLLVNYKFEKTGFTATLKIFDDNGRLAKQLTTNQLLNTEGSIKWEGERDDGTLAPVGIYILLAEWTNGKGETQRQKMAFALSQ